MTRNEIKNKELQELISFLKRVNKIGTINKKDMHNLIITLSCLNKESKEYIKIRNKLTLYNIRLIIKVIKGLNTANSYIHDLFQEGYDILKHAIEKLDISKYKAESSHYFYKCIKRHLIRVINNENEYNIINNSKEKLSEDFKKQKENKNIKIYKNIYNLKNDSIKNTNYNNFSSNEIIKSVENNEVLERFYNFLDDDLSELEKQLIEDKMNNNNLESIAKKNNISRSKAKNIIYKTQEKIKEHFKDYF